jgi:phage host-nuclease inhibitor protein Gam
MYSSYDEVDVALLALARQTTFLQKEEADLNKETQSLRAAFDARTAKAKEEIDRLNQAIESFCMVHKEDFERVRSRTLTHGVVSFRTAPPKVSFLNRKYNAKTVIELVKRLGYAKRFLRSIIELDKEAILAENAEKKITDEKLAALGLKIDQAENFEIEIKWDSITD